MSVQGTNSGKGLLTCPVCKTKTRWTRCFQCGTRIYVKSLTDETTWRPDPKPKPAK